MIVLLIFAVAIGCSDSENKRTSRSKDDSISIKKIQEDKKKSLKSKIDLLCLKYEVESEPLKKELMEYLVTDFIATLDEDNKESNYYEEIKKYFHEKVAGTVIDTKKLIAMSKKHNVPVKKVAGIVYDYLIWEKL